MPGPLMHRLSLMAAFALGACAATAASTSASTTQTPSASESDEMVLVGTMTSAPVTAIEQAERRTAPNGKATVTILARGLNAFVARLEMEPGAAVPEHRDATEEYIHVLEGSGTITIDDQSYPLAAGGTVYMPANAKVSFVNGDAPLVGLQVFAGPEPAAKYEAWAPAS